MEWTTADIPELSGRTAVVTGATDGLGLEMAQALAGRGARVILAARSPDKGARALARIRRAYPGGDVAFESVELSELASVRALAARLQGGPVDILVNNAGVMAPPRTVTPDGFELQFAVNYLSHFVLTGLLLPALRQAAAPRVVSLSSLAHTRGRIDFDDLQGERRYSPFGAYAQSKLAMLLFARELQRQSDRHGWRLLSVAAHPGVASTNLIKFDNPLATSIARKVVPLFGQDSVQGALPQLMAATAADVTPGGYLGPAGFMEMRGPPAPAHVRGQGSDDAAAARLWEVSQALTGSPFGAGA